MKNSLKEAGRPEEQTVAAIRVSPSLLKILLAQAAYGDMIQQALGRE
jgi:hypothetical protein